jgi:hypothetical protein
MEANWFAKILAGTMGYNPNNHELPIFWLCPEFLSCHMLLRLAGAQAKQPQTNQ